MALLGGRREEPQQDPPGPWGWRSQARRSRGAGASQLGPSCGGGREAIMAVTVRWRAWERGDRGRTELGAEGSQMHLAECQQRREGWSSVHPHPG